MGEEQHVRLAQRMLALRPGYFFDLDPAAAALHAPHAVEEHDGEAPERNKLEAPHAELVVAGALRWQPEQRALEPCRGRTSISMVLASAHSRARS